MKKIEDFINESLNEFTILLQLDDSINESNEQIFPKPGKYAKLKIDVGDHAYDRQKERKVTNNDIIDAIFGAYNDINKMYKEGILKVSKNGKDSRFLIVDSRKNQNEPINVVGFIFKNKHEKKLLNPIFIIKTVFKGDDFAGAKRVSDDAEQHKIFLY